jgi:hypothetical protein
VTVQFSIFEDTGWYEVRDTTANESWWVYSDDIQAYSSSGLHVTASFQPDGSEPPKTWLIIPGDRVTHSLVLNQRNASNALVTYPVTIGGSVLGGPETDGWSTYDPTRPFWITDTTTSERTLAGALDLSRTTWSYDPTVYPPASVSVAFESYEVGHRFSVYTQAPGGPVVAQSQYAYQDLGGTRIDHLGNSIVFPSSVAKLTFNVGRGMTFWIRREADNITSNQWYVNAPVNTSTLWDGRGIFPQQPQRSTVAKTFRVRVDTRYSHPLTVVMSDGYCTNITVGSANATISTWNGQSVSNPLSVYSFVANVDPEKSWWLRDDSTNEFFSVEQTDVLDGWVPDQIPPSAPDPITIILPEWRAYTSVALQNTDSNDWWSQEYNPWQGTMSDDYFPGVDGMAPYLIRSYTTSLENLSPNTIGPFCSNGAIWKWLVDNSNPGRK